MKIGVNDIVDCKIGTNQVAKVYLGSNLVWEKSGSTLLLDVYPNASAAYSLRKLRTAYTGDAIEVRIDTATTPQPSYNIGFDSDGNLDTADLLSKAGSNDAYVAVWYDQSGNANNATQVSATLQPQIVNLGVVVTDNGLPTIDYSTSGNDYLSLTTRLVNVGSAFLIYNAEISSGTNTQLLLGDTSSYNYHAGSGDNILNGSFSAPSVYNGSNYINSISKNFTNTIRPTDQSLISMIHTSSTNAVSQLTKDRNFTGRSWKGNMQEVILYPSDQSANRAGIQTNINTNYNIYWDGSQTGLLDDYPNASAAYSLRALNSAYTGASIKVRRSSDNAEQDINLLYDGSLNTSSLLSFVGSNDGFVTVWYDQSGNNEDASDSNANSQASIVLSGVLNTTNGNPAALGQSNSGYTTGRSIFNGADGTFSGFVVSKLTNQFDGVICLRDSGADLFRYFNTSSSTFRVQSWANGGGSQVLVTEPISANSDAISSFIRGLDTLSTSSNTLTNSMSGLSAPLKHTGDNLTVMGFTNGNAGLESYFSEAILYPFEQSSNRVAIETNINNHYTIY